MARDGQRFEWTSSDDGRNECPLLPPPWAGTALARRLQAKGFTRGPLRTRTARRVLAAVIVVMASVGLARLGADNKLPTAPVNPPSWLQDRPLSAPLSPFMAAECWHRHCAQVTASVTDVREARAGLNFWFTVTAMRILDERREVRGSTVQVVDAHGDTLTIDAVRVSAAPIGWDDQSTTWASGDATSRWVVREGDGVWLTEARASLGDCETDEDEYGILYERTLTRVPASQIAI